MFCTKCGTKLPDDAIFCATCGTKVNDSDKVTTVKNGISSSNKKWLFAVVLSAICIVAVIVFIISWLFEKSDLDKAKEGLYGKIQSENMGSNDTIDSFKDTSSGYEKNKKMHRQSDIDTSSDPDNTTAAPTLADVFSQYEVSDEIKNAKLTDNNWQVFDEIFYGGKTTFKEIRETLSHKFDDYPEIEYSDDYDMMDWFSQGDDYSTSDTLHLNVQYSDGVDTVSFGINFIKDPDKANDKGAEYYDDYLFSYINILDLTHVSQEIMPDEHYSKDGDFKNYKIFSPLFYYFYVNGGMSSTKDEVMNALKNGGVQEGSHYLESKSKVMFDDYGDFINLEICERKETIQVIFQYTIYFDLMTDKVKKIHLV